MNTERQDTKSILLSASLIYTLAHLSPLAHTHTCLPVVSNVTQHHTTQRNATQPNATQRNPTQRNAVQRNTI